MGKGLIIALIIVILLITGGIFIYFNPSQINEQEVRQAVSNYLYEDKLKECNSDSNDNYIYGNDCEDYYRCYSEEYSQNIMGTYVNEIKNRLNDRGAKSSTKLTYEDVKIIPEIENNDQYSSYDINHKCFLQIYGGKGLVSPSDAKDYFEEASKNIPQQDVSERDCLIEAIKSRISSSEATALANFIKSDEEKYYSAGFEIFRGISVIENQDLLDFTDQCSQS